MSISGLSILFHLFLYLYSSANTTQLWLLYVLKSSRMIPLTILFFSKLFRNSSSYVFPFKFKIILSISTKKLSEILIGVPLNLYIDLGRINPEEGNGNPLQYSCLENPMDGGAWWATVHGSQRVTSLHFRAVANDRRYSNSYKVTSSMNISIAWG